MLTFTLMTESFDDGRWKRYAIPAALLAAGGGIYYLATHDSDPEENAYHTFKRNVNNLYNNGLEKTEQLKKSATKAWDDSESTRQNMRTTIDNGINKADEYKNIAVQKWGESAPARDEFVDDIKSGYNNHIRPFFDRIFPKS